MARYYKVDSRKITFVEYWRITSNFKGFFWGCIFKIFQLPVKLSDGIPEPTTLADRVAQKTELPPHLVEKLDAGVADYEKLGFGDVYYYNTKNKITSGESAGVHLLHASGETTATIVSVRVRGRERTVMSLSSLLENGGVIATSNRPAEYNNPPGLEIERMVGSNALQLWQRHSQKLEAMRMSEPLQKLLAAAAYEKLFEISTKRIFEYNVRRGLWVEMTPEEITVARKKLPPPLPKTLKLQ
jgi:hypothetical protein